MRGYGQDAVPSNNIAAGNPAAMSMQVPQPLKGIKEMWTRQQALCQQSR
jgi:hypothetical protein